MDKRIPTSVLSIIKAEKEQGEKLITIICRMTGNVKAPTKGIIFPGEKEFQIKSIKSINNNSVKIKVKGLPFDMCKPF